MGGLTCVTAPDATTHLKPARRTEGQ